MPGSYRKGLRKRSIPENDKTGTRLVLVRWKFQSPLCQDSQKDKRKKSYIFQDTPVECSNDRKTSRKECPFVKWPEESRELNLDFSGRKTFTVEPVFNKQNDWGVTFGNYFTEHRRVSVTNHPASIVMHGAVNRTGRRCLRFSLNGLQAKRCHLGFAKKIWRRKFFRRSLRNQIHLPPGRSADTHGKYSAILVGHQHELLAPGILHHTVTRFESRRCQLVDVNSRNNLQNTPQQHRWPQGFCKPRMAVEGKTLR